ncbi:hypothetical protein DFP74_3218 [Nocardiopsis sp. Huas11]|nr:hypothetical protein DFP74_3218 [Nocardiopsis sp. Huas11]
MSVCVERPLAARGHAALDGRGALRSGVSEGRLARGARLWSRGAERLLRPRGRTAVGGLRPLGPLSTERLLSARGHALAGLRARPGSAGLVPLDTGRLLCP